MNGRSRECPCPADPSSDAMASADVVEGHERAILRVAEAGDGEEETQGRGERVEAHRVDGGVVEMHVPEARGVDRARLVPAGEMGRGEAVEVDGERELRVLDANDRRGVDEGRRAVVP